MLPSPIPSSSVFISANISIHLIQPLDIRPIFKTYNILITLSIIATHISGIRPTYRVYTKLSSIRPTLIPYMPSNTKLIFAAYI